MAKATKKSSKKATAPEVEPEELEEDEELEELEEDEIEEVAPKKKSGGTREVTFGVSDIVAYLTDQGHKVDTRGLRTLIRKMARDESGRVQREIVAGNRTRYDWPKGLKDPEVKAIIKAFEDGELEADKKEKLAALKDRKAAEQKEIGKVKGKKKKATKVEPVIEEDDDEDEDLDLEDDE